jgi:Cu/Ag efflux protein CusF
VADPQLLDGLAEGSKVRFDAAKVNGQYTVTRLVPVR